MSDAHKGKYSSLAHSAGCGVIAVSARPVGIDMEFVRPRTYERELARAVATKREYAVLRSMSHVRNTYDLTTRAWVIKEAARKVLRDPRPYHPRELCIESCCDTTCSVYDKKNDARMRVLIVYKDGAYVAVAEQHRNACPFAGITVSIA